jgi:hypothetical protein
MRVNLTSQRRRRWLASLLAVAFALRALIPAGFMPAGNGTVALQICPEGIPAALLATLSGDEHAAHHHHNSWTSGHHCTFGAAAGAPPLCHSSIVAFVVGSQVLRPYTTVIAPSLDFRFRLAQPRAPPSPLA